MTSKRPPIPADQELGLRNAGWTLVQTEALARLNEAWAAGEAATWELVSVSTELVDLRGEMPLGLLSTEMLEGWSLAHRKLNATVESLVEVYGEPGGEADA